jgi:hypothetical protein
MQGTMTEPLPDHDHAAIRRAPVLQAMDGDRSLTDLRLVVAGSPLAVLVGTGSELAGQQVVGETDGLPEPAQVFPARCAGPRVRELGVL